MRRLGAARRRIVALAIKALMQVAGVAILYHEVFEAKSPDGLLVFVGLYLCGVPPAMFFDGLRRFNDFVTGIEGKQGTGRGLDTSEDDSPTKHHHGGPWDV